MGLAKMYEERMDRWNKQSSLELELKRIVFGNYRE